MMTILTRGDLAHADEIGQYGYNLAQVGTEAPGLTWLLLDLKSAQVDLAHNRPNLLPLT